MINHPQQRLSRLLLPSLLLAALAVALAEESWSGGLLVAAATFSGWYFNERRIAARTASTGEPLPPHPLLPNPLLPNPLLPNPASPAPLALPRWLSTTLLILATLAAAARGYLFREPVSAFMWLLAAILILKIWERRAIRDYAQILTVIAFITIGAALGDTSLLLGLVIAAQVLSLLSAVLWYQLRSAQWIASHSPLDPNRYLIAPSSTSPPSPTPTTPHTASTTPAPPPHTANPRLATDLRYIRWITIVAGGAIAAAAFIFVPRGGGLQRLGDFGLPLSRTTGFADVVDLDQSGLISESQQPVMTVRLRDANNQPTPPPSGRLYLRGAALDEYSGREWRASIATNPDSRINRRASSAYPRVRLPSPLGRPQSPVIQQIISVRSLNLGDSPVFTLWRPQSITLPPDTSVRFDDVTLSIVHVKGGDPALTEYTIISSPPSEPNQSLQGVLPQQALPTGAELTNLVGNPDEGPTIDASPARRAKWLATRAALTFKSPALRQVAQRILTSQGLDVDPNIRNPADDRRAAQLLSDYVRDVCRYTLDVPPSPLKADPIENFLLESRAGHCELFASALAALCRSSGINARVIAGYAASEYDEASDTFTVRQADAHAWCEVSIDPSTWITMDAVPDQSVTALREAQAGWFTHIERLLADARDRWNNAIVMFDAAAQQRLLGAPNSDRAWYLTISDKIQRLALQFESTRLSTAADWLAFFKSPLARPLIAPAAAFASLILLFLLWRWHLRRKPSLPIRTWGLPSHTAQLVGTLAHALDSYFTRTGNPRPAFATPRSHAAATKQPQPPDEQADNLIEQAIDSLYAAAFSPRPPTDQTLRELAKALQRLKA